MIYQNSNLTSKLYPTLTEYMTATKNADNIDDRQRDIRPLMSILERMSIASPRLSGNILTRRTALQSYDWDIVNSENKRGTDAEEVSTRTKAAINAIIKHYVNLPLFGALAIQFTWELIDGRYYPRVSKVYGPTELERGSEGLYYVTTLSSTQQQKTPVLTIPEQQIIWAVDEKNWAGGILRSVAIHEILRNETYQEWSNFNRKLKGLIQAKASEEEKGDASNALKSFISNNYTVTGQEVEFKFNELTSSKGAEAFSTFIQKLEDDIAVAILGQANSTQLPNNGGSRAAMQILDLIRKDIHFSDVNHIKELVQKLLLYDFQINSQMNAQATPYQFDFIFDEVMDIEANARTIEIAVRSGIPIKKSDAYSKLALSVPEAGDELLETKPQSTAPVAPSFGPVQ